VQIAETRRISRRVNFICTTMSNGDAVPIRPGHGGDPHDRGAAR
jgi:hypothetical protein